jgi:hypothetical protein
MKNRYRRYSWRMPTGMDNFEREVIHTQHLLRQMYPFGVDEPKPQIINRKPEAHDNLPY